MAKTVLIAVADGTEDIEAVAVIDVLRRAGAEVTVASSGPALQVTASRGTRIVADAMLADSAEKTYDLIVVPGGMPGSTNLAASDVLADLLRRQRQAGRLYAAICAAPVVVLQAHGLLDGVRATCFPSLQSKLDPGRLSHDRVVVDQGCITSQGAGTAIEFGLVLVEQLFGPAKAREVGQAMVVALP